MGMFDIVTRDNFNPTLVLVWLRDGTMPDSEAKRLLEEACHAFQRQRTVLENARAVVHGLQQDLGHE